MRKTRRDSSAPLFGARRGAVPTGEERTPGTLAPALPCLCYARQG